MARVVEERKQFYVGLDLGKSADFSALAVVERCELVFDEIADHVRYERRKDVQYRLRHVERIPLGTSYPDVVSRTRGLLGRLMPGGVGVRTMGRTLIVDATGVGSPVVDLLRAARLDCTLVPVVFTAGDRAHEVGSTWHVPKAELVTGMQVAFQQRLLRVAKGIEGGEALWAEMASMREKGPRQYEGEPHDDLVMAVALAWWRAKARAPGEMAGRGRLI